jgi:LysM repeat protein
MAREQKLAGRLRQSTPCFGKLSSLVFGKRFRKLREMLSRLLIGCFVFAITFLPAVTAQVEMANLREDVRGLMQRVSELGLRVEQLEREHADLRRKNADTPRAYATVAQLNEAVADLNRAIKSSVGASQGETLQIVSAQLEKLGKQTNAALESLAKSQSSRPVPAQSAGASIPALDGASYTVQKGDTLALIAKKTGAKQQDIVSANKISDPSLIKVGQTLIIPAAK